MLTTVELPSSARAVVVSLAEDRDRTALMAGGTLVMPVLLNGHHTIQRLVILGKAGLGDVAVRDGVATVGAAAILAGLAAQPKLAVLRSAIESIGSPTLRNMATVGGNLFAPQPYGDLAVCLLALDAEVRVQASAGEQILPVEQLIRDGIEVGAILTSVRFQVPAVDHWYYRKAMRRQMNSAAIITVAAHLPIVGGVVAGARVALGGVAPKVVRARSAERVLEGQPLVEEVVSEAAEAVVQDAEPVTDAYASAWYRRRVLPVHMRRALLRAQDGEGSGGSA